MSTIKFLASIKNDIMSLEGKLRLPEIIRSSEVRISKYSMFSHTCRFFLFYMVTQSPVYTYYRNVDTKVSREGKGTGRRRM